MVEPSSSPGSRVRVVAVAVGVGALIVCAGLSFGPALPEAPRARVEPVPVGSITPGRRIVRPVPGLQAEPDEAAVSARVGMSEAITGLARAVAGYPVECAAPPDLPDPLTATGLRRPSVRGGRFFAVATVPDGAASVFWNREPELAGCERLFDESVDTDCPARRREVVETTRLPEGIVRWTSDGEGRATCTFEPVEVVPISGTVTTADGSDPDVWGVFGCVDVVARGTRFTGSTYKGTSCVLFASGDARWGSIVVPPFGPWTGLEIVMEPQDPQADGPPPFVDLQDQLRAEAEEETPEVRVLADPSLSPEARAIVHQWVENDLATVAQRLEILRSALGPTR